MKERKRGHNTMVLVCYIRKMVSKKNKTNNGGDNINLGSKTLSPVLRWWVCSSAGHMQKKILGKILKVRAFIGRVIRLQFRTELHLPHIHGSWKNGRRGEDAGRRCVEIKAKDQRQNPQYSNIWEWKRNEEKTQKAIWLISPTTGHYTQRKP